MRLPHFLHTFLSTAAGIVEKSDIVLQETRYGKKIATVVREKCLICGKERTYIGTFTTRWVIK